jgi:hypothetical protein
MFALDRYGPASLHLPERWPVRMGLAIALVTSIAASATAQSDLSLQIVATPPALPCTVPPTAVTQCLTTLAGQTAILDTILANNGIGSASSPQIAISVFRNGPVPAITPAEVSASITPPPGYSCTAPAFGPSGMVIFCSGDPATTLPPGATVHFSVSTVFHISTTDQLYIAFASTLVFDTTPADNMAFMAVAVAANVPTLPVASLVLLVLSLGVAGYFTRR